MTDERCGDESPSGYVCSLPEGHDGEHEAAREKYNAVVRWPQ